MMKSSVLAVALSALVLAGCANHHLKVYDYSALKQSDPRSILVVMPTSDSTDIRAESSVLAQATVPLAEPWWMRCSARTGLPTDTIFSRRLSASCARSSVLMQ